MTKIELIAKIASMNKADVKTLKANAEKRGEASRHRVHQAARAAWRSG
jgi:hypothetical protein